MNMQKLSINKVCVLLGTLLLLAVGAVCAAVYLLTQNITAVRCVFLFSLFVLLCVICFVALIRRKLVRFSDAFCGQMDDMLSGDMQPKQTVEEESLFYKINYRLGRLYEVMQENKNSIAKERADLQELISDISHQVKTPIANLKMINNTLLENEVPPQKQKEFLTAQASQLDKLDFLMQAMIKTSRLETGVISLEQKQQPVYDTLAAALGGILLNAEKKQIDVQVECPEHLDARHDRKWTSEALFNILDNAVKYTPAGGQIRVSVEGWEMYVKIDIADTGIGISELSGDISHYEELADAITGVSPVPILYAAPPGAAKGCFNHVTEEILVRPGMSQKQTVKTMLHEISHATLHRRKENERPTKDQHTREVEAESVAYVVCQHFGIDTAEYSFGYVAGWSKGKELDELKASLDTIRTCAAGLIDAIEARCPSLCPQEIQPQEKTHGGEARA